MLFRKPIDAYPVASILLVFSIDLTFFFLSPSALLTILWVVLTLPVRGWICSWNHNHQHLKFFYSKWANRTLELILGLQTGIVGEAWVLHHTLGHHINYLDQTKDESAWKDQQGRTMSRLRYTLVVAGLAYPTALKVGKRYPRKRAILVQNMLATLVVLAGLAWLNWLNTLLLFVFPMIAMLILTARETYRHHTGLDESDPHKASYNITDRWYNFFTCNLGYHTAHHMRCGLHWSQLPQLHAKIEDKIPAHLYLEPGFPFSQLTSLTDALGRRKAVRQAG